jgi:hypothetical protein
MLKSSSLCLYSSNSGTFWLKIDKFWSFEEISIFSNGGHLGYRTALTDTILKGTHPGTIPARFGLIWFSGFRGEDLNVIFYQNMPNLHSSPQKPLGQLQPNFGGMVLGLPPSKMVSDDPDFQLRWPPS